jgi:hypothetical protein
MKMSGRCPRRRPHTWWIDKVKRDVERREWGWRAVDECTNGADRDI